MSLGFALPLVAALSGASGLIFEIVWFERCGLVFGDSVRAATVVLSSFMAGLAIGNGAVRWLAPRIRRPIRTYAAVECAIAVTGIALVYGLPHFTRLQLPSAAAFLLLLIPAGAMGATLPLLVGALTPGASTPGATSFGWALGTLYGWNTAGAVGGTLVAERVLIARAGIAGSAWTAALLDALAASIALVLSRSERSEGVTERQPSPRPAVRVATSPVLVAAAGLSGFSLLALEVIWFRFLSMFVLTTTLVMSLMLAVVLTGVAVGGLLAARWSRWTGRAAVNVPIVALAIGMAVAGSYAAFATQTSGTEVGEVRRIVWFAMLMTFPPSLLSGVLFTLLGDAIKRFVPDATRAAATLTLANTLGAAIGPPIAALVLLPRLGTERALFALAITYAAIAALTLSRSAPRLTWAAAAAFTLVALRFPFGLMTSAYLPRIAQTYAADGSRIVATHEGPTESIILMQQLWMGHPIYDRLVTNGFSMSGTAIPGQRYMRYFVYWPMLTHRQPLQRILVVCYGVGVTAGAAVDVPSATSIDIVELSRGVVSMSDIIYAGGGNPLRDSRVRLHIEDGRHFLATTGERFDLITGEPPPPRTPGAVNLYTREYFELIRERLADNGITTYWLPVARPNPGADVDTIVRAFCDVFADCSLWNATPFDLMLVGTRDGRGTFDRSRFEALRDRFREIGFEAPEQIGATFLGDAAYLRRLTAGTPPLTDDFPERLRPVTDRPSLSDPRYPVDLSVVAHYQRVLDPSRAREAFRSSEFIRRWWPEPLIQASLPWFDEEAMINRVLWEGGKPVRLIEDLDAALTRTPLRTPLRTLPLWILGTDEIKQRVAAMGNDGTGTVEYLRGAQLLVNHHDEEAASYFGLAERRGLGTPAVRPMIAYALCRAGRRPWSKQVADTIQPRDADARHFRDWMASNCQ